jgi:hypothetical protein
MLNPTDYAPIETFIRQRLEVTKPGGRLLHGMLYPGVYPPDEAAHAKLLAGEQADLSQPFFESVRTLVRRGVTVDRLRVLPTRGVFHHSLDDVRAMVSQTEQIDRATGMRTRHVGYIAAAEAMDRALPAGTNKLADDYRSGACERSPHNSFWAIQQPIGNRALALTTVGIMWYEKREPLGVQTHTAPFDLSVLEYIHFWDQQFAAASSASTANL